MPLRIIRENITEMQVDAIVNTTNEQMVGYSGVDLAVHKAAGSGLDQECAALVPLELGKAKLTKGYKLKAKYIIHTAGPEWQGGLSQEEQILRSCYRESLRLAAEKGFETVAFPLISAGNYGFPKDRALHSATETITEFLRSHELTVYLCIWDRTAYEIGKQLYDALFTVLHEREKSFDACCAEAAPPEKRPRRSRNLNGRRMTGACAESKIGGTPETDLKDYLQSLDKSFANKLFDLIDRKGMTDVECYKKANVDKKTFSKLKCNPDTYRPSKQTAVAFAIALRLTLPETQELLASAGFALSDSLPFDKIIRYFIANEIYDVFTVNEALFEFDQITLGC